MKTTGKDTTTESSVIPAAPGTDFDIAASMREQRMAHAAQHKKGKAATIPKTKTTPRKDTAGARVCANPDCDVVMPITTGAKGKSYKVDGKRYHAQRCYKNAQAKTKKKSS